MAGLHERGEITPKRINEFSLERIWNRVRGYVDPSDTPEHAVEIQAEYGRRLSHGDHIEIGGEVWRIVDITKGADGAPVVVSNGIRTESIASLQLERIEAVAREHVTPPPGGPTPVPTGSGPRPPVRPPVVPPAGSTVVRTAPTGPIHRVSLRYGAADISDSADDAIRDAAEIELHAEKGAAGMWDKFFKHNIAYEEYRQRGIARGRAKVLAEDNVYAAHGLSRDAHVKATDATIDRILQDEAEFLHSEDSKNGKGERRRQFGDSPEEQAVKAQLVDLIKEYAANPAMDARELKRRKDAIFKEANALAGEAKGKGMMYADNLDRLADQVRQHAAAAGGMENLDIDLDIVVARAKLGARTEREKNLVDSALEKLERWGKDGGVVGGVLAAFRNEIAVAVAATVGIGQMVVRSGLSSTVGKLVTFGGSGLVSGVYGWWKEKGRLRSEQALHERETTMGAKLREQESPEQMRARLADLNTQLGNTSWINFSERERIKSQILAIRRNETDQPRRKEMQEFELARTSARQLAEDALAIFDPSERTLRQGVRLGQAVDVLADIEARIRLSNSQNVDLLSYSNMADAEVERRNLDMVRMQLKAALREMYDGDATGAIDRSTYATFQSYYDNQLGLREDALFGRESDSRKQQKKFADWSQRQALKRGATNVVIGAGVGLVLHDLWALASGGDTTVGSAVHALKEYFNNAPTVAAGAPVIEHIGGSSFSLPHDTHLAPQADGSFTLESIVGGRPAIATGLHLDSSDHLDAASIAKLQGMGGTVVETTGWTNAPGSMVEHKEGIWEWFKHHGNQKIHRLGWDDNDTPMHFSADMQKWLGADHNELELEFGGVGGTGLDSQGNIVMTMENMFPAGSFHDGVHHNAPAEIVERKIRLLLSMSKGSQGTVAEVMSNQQGQFVIDPDSDIAKTFFKVENGHAIFKGFHAEVGLSAGTDANHVNNLFILATHKGDGITSGITSVSTGECIPNDLTQIALPPGSAPHDIPVPWIVPVRRRTPLEPLTPGRRSGPGSGPGPEPEPPVSSGSESGTESGSESGRESSRGRERGAQVATIREFADAAFVADSQELKDKKIGLLQVMLQGIAPGEQRNFMTTLQAIDGACKKVARDGGTVVPEDENILSPHLSPLMESGEREDVILVASACFVENPDFRNQDLDTFVKAIQVFLLNS